MNRWQYAGLIAAAMTGPRVWNRATRLVAGQYTRALDQIGAGVYGTMSDRTDDMLRLMEKRLIKAIQGEAEAAAEPAQAHNLLCKDNDYIRCDEH